MTAGGAWPRSVQDQAKRSRGACDAATAATTRCCGNALSLDLLHLLSLAITTAYAANQCRITVIMEKDAAWRRDAPRSAADVRGKRPGRDGWLPILPRALQNRVAILDLAPR